VARLAAADQQHFLKLLLLPTTQQSYDSRVL
jgi:hypothetical protein